MRKQARRNDHDTEEDPSFPWPIKFIENLRLTKRIKSKSRGEMSVPDLRKKAQFSLLGFPETARPRSFLFQQHGPSLSLSLSVGVDGPRERTGRRKD